MRFFNEEIFESSKKLLNLKRERRWIIAGKGAALLALAASVFVPTHFLIEDITDMMFAVAESIQGEEYREATINWGTPFLFMGGGLACSMTVAGVLGKTYNRNRHRIDSLTELYTTGEIEPSRTDSDETALTTRFLTIDVLSSTVDSSEILANTQQKVAI